jgi:osmotically-inducible protein OsmY
MARAVRTTHCLPYCRSQITTTRLMECRTVMEATACLSPLANEIHGTLEQSPYISTQEVQVNTDQGHVRLEGTVRSFFQKQMAQELIRRMDGVERIDNMLRVNWR